MNSPLRLFYPLQPFQRCVKNIVLMPLLGPKKKEVITKYRRHDSDTGSPEVQIAIISKRITELSTHFDLHKKDNSSRRGLIKLVGQRRKLLSFLKVSNKGRYSKLIEELGIRK